MPRSDVPFGSEFSPSQIDLPIILEIAHRHGSNWKAFEAEVRDRYFSDYATSDYNKGKLANNTKLSMRAYGLIGNDDTQLTHAGLALFALRSDGDALYEAFSRHILKFCQGANFVQCILDMHAAAEEINLNKLRHWLKERGISVPRGAKHMSTLRLWLEKAGVFISGYRVDKDRLETILGIGVEELEALAAFTPEQKAYIKALANIGASGPHPSNEIEKLAAATYGVNFNEKSLPKQILYPLRDAGYVALARGTRETGRGAKPFLVTATEKFASDLIGPSSRTA
jgi:hypothetical protein